MQPNFFLIRSASGMGVRRPTAMSLVKLSPPIGIVDGTRGCRARRWPPGRARADVDQPDAELALVLGQDGLGRGDLVEDDLLDADLGPRDATLEVLERGHGGGDDVDVDLELDAAHADRVLDAVLVVDDELLGDDVDDVAVRGDGDGLGLVDDAPHVLAGDLAVLAGDGDDAAAVEALDVGPGDAEEGRVDLHARP